jgi:hypothetical protein
MRAREWGKTKPLYVATRYGPKTLETVLGWAIVIGALGGFVGGLLAAWLWGVL